MVLTLYVVPAFYSLLTAREWKRSPEVVGAAQTLTAEARRQGASS